MQDEKYINIGVKVYQGVARWCISAGIFFFPDSDIFTTTPQPVAPLEFCSLWFRFHSKYLACCDLFKMKVLIYFSLLFNLDDGSRLLSNGRPKCNSILHLFGPWLFEAALINCNLQASPGSQHSMYCNIVLYMLPEIFYFLI